MPDPIRSWGHDSGPLPGLANVEAMGELLEGQIPTYGYVLLDKTWVRTDAVVAVEPAPHDEFCLVHLVSGSHLVVRLPAETILSDLGGTVPVDLPN